MRKKWQTSMVLMVSLIIAYFDRINVTFIIPDLAESFAWTPEETGTYGGLIMSLFYVSYGVSNIFFSSAAMKIGPRKSLLIMVVLWSLFTALGAVFSQVFVLFLMCRIFLGFSEGVHFPMMSALTVKWFPIEERSRGNGLWLSGIFIAVITAPLILVPLISAFGWRSMFYVQALLGLMITLPLIYFFIFNEPKVHPRITEPELTSDRVTETDSEPQNNGLSLLKDPTFLLLIAISIANNAVVHGISSWLPSYFTYERELPFDNLTYAVSLPYLSSIPGILLWSVLGDKLNKRSLISAISFLFVIVSIILSMNAATLGGTIASLSFGVFFISAFSSSEYAIAQRVIPESRTAQGVGLYNGIGIIGGGGLGPLFVGGMVSLTNSYSAGILSLAAIAALAGILLYILYIRIKY